MAEKEEKVVRIPENTILPAVPEGKAFSPEEQKEIQKLREKGLWRGVSAGGATGEEWDKLKGVTGDLGKLIRTFRRETNPLKRKKIVQGLDDLITQKEGEWKEATLSQAQTAYHYMIGETLEAQGVVRPGESAEKDRERPPKEKIPRRKERGKAERRVPPGAPREPEGGGSSGSPKESLRPPEGPPGEPPQPPENILSGENGPIRPGKYTLTKETARQVLASSEYVLFSRAEQAAVRRIAEVKPARRHIYDPSQEKPPIMVLSDFHGIHKERIRKVTGDGAITLSPDTEEPGEMRIDFVREKLTQRDDLIAAVYDVLMNAVYMRRFALGTDNFLDYALGRLRQDKDVYAALTSWKGAIHGLVDFWGKSVKGKGGAGESMINMIADGTLKLPPELIHLLLTDPRIEVAYHNASTRGLEQLRYEEEVILEKTGDKLKVAPTVKKREEKWVARDTVDVAYDMIGELLHGVTLKVRFDWRQAPRDYYIVYKTDQPGLQLSEGKYNHTEFARLLTRDSRGRIRLVWNNGMPTLWTNANRESLVNKWMELITSDDPSVYKDEKGMAWLISYAGDDIDRRLSGFESLDYEDWLHIQNPEERKRILGIYLNMFREDINAGDERTARAKHAIRANMSRMRTVWHPEILSVVTGGKIDLSKKVPGCPIGVPANEQGFDLDVVRFNPETKEWEFCLNFNWFFQNRDNEAGAVLGEDISDLATYESYKITHYNEAVYPTTMASSFKDFSKRPEIIDALLTEDLGKQLYSVPEYRELLRVHLIDQLVRQEMTASLYVERYRGRSMNFLKGVKEKTFYLEWLLNKTLHFESCGIRGTWAQAQTSEFQETTPGKKIRMVMQENSHVEIWEKFAQENGVDLETLLVFMGVRRLSWEEIADLQNRGEFPSELTRESADKYLVLEYLNTRKVTHPLTGEERTAHDFDHDNVYEGAWAKKLIGLLRTDWNRARPTGERSLAEKLMRLGKLVAPYEDGAWASEIAEVIAAQKEISPENRALAVELIRLQRAIPQDMSADWRILTPWHIMRIARKLNWKFEGDTELFADYEDAVRHGKGDNWLDAGDGVMMVDFLKARKRVNKRTWQHVVPLGKYRSYHLFRQWNDDKNSPDYGTPLEEPYNQGISLIRNLWGGWWTYQPETGLQERPPFYVETDMVSFMGSLLNAPYRQETARRLADAAYAQLFESQTKIKKRPEDITQRDRETDLWKQLHGARLREEMIVAPGPDWWEAELFLLGFLGLVGVEGKMTIDELPRNEFVRWFGIETLRRPDGSGANRYRDYLIHKLNIRRFVPRVTNPDQLERVIQTIKETQARSVRDMENLQKYAALAPEALEAAAFLGLSLPELRQEEYGDTPVDNAPQVTNMLVGLITPPLLYWGLAATTSMIPSSSILLILANTIVPFAGARLGWLFGTDVGDESDLHRIPLIKLFRIEALKVPAGSIARLQKQLPMWKLNPFGLFGRFSKPIAVRREEELQAGRGHETGIKTGHAAGWITMWKENFD